MKRRDLPYFIGGMLAGLLLAGIFCWLVRGESVQTSQGSIADTGKVLNIETDVTVSQAGNTVGSLNRGTFLWQAGQTQLLLRRAQTGNAEEWFLPVDDDNTIPSGGPACATITP